MIHLPKWVIPDNHPAFFDSESATAIEMVAKLYGSMCELVGDYNEFIERIEKLVNDYHSGITTEFNEFATALRQEFQDFIDIINLKIKGQDNKIDNMIEYVMNNTQQFVEDIIAGMRESGEMDEAILIAFDNLNERLTEAIQQEQTARTEAIAEETNARDLAIQQETRNREEAIQQEQTARAEAITDEANARDLAIQQEAEARDQAIREAVASMDRDTIRFILYPRLPEDKMTAMRANAYKYVSNSTAFVYNDVGTTRNTLQNSSCYDSNGKVKINCSLFAQLVWAGVSPETFTLDPANYDGTLNKVIDWGYEFLFPHRKAYGITREDGTFYGLTKPNGADDLTDSYSFNSYYSSTPDNATYQQKFKSYLHACDMAQELWVRGFEVPMSEVQPGDLVFYRTLSDDDGDLDRFEDLAFREITHVGFVYNTDNLNEGYFKIIECSPWNNDKPIAYRHIASSYDTDIVRATALDNRLCMVARHPHAFGVAGNVGNKFTVL